MRNLSLLLVSVTLSLAAPSALAQTIYRCHKADGSGLLFQDKPCSDNTVEARIGVEGDAVGDTSVDAAPSAPGLTAEDHYERYLTIIEQEHQEARADALAQAQVRAQAQRAEAALAPPALPGPVSACEADSAGSVPLGCNGYPVYGGFHYPTHYVRPDAHRHGGAYISESHGVLVYHPPRSPAGSARTGGFRVGSSTVR